ncbi:hypothetical protein ACFUCV_04430 [Specibacter sp. NPDC057265]|uniref:hypothetical protein n=1 Tax=Specibacter sp. NPDC057265 TaxID=3346075 RepID=UPI00363AA4B6
MLELLFGSINGFADAAAVSLSLAGTLVLCVALLLLGRRSEVGWWLVPAVYGLQAISALLTYSTGWAVSVLGLALFVAGAAVPLLLGAGIGLYGLLLFRKFPREAPLTRAIALRPFSPFDVVAPLSTAVVFGLAALLPLLSVFASLGRFTQLPPAALLNTVLFGVLAGLLPAGLVGLAHRCRWAWLLLVLPCLLDIYSAVLTAAGSAAMLLSMAAIVLALYGWKRWGALSTANRPLPQGNHGAR